MIKRYSILNATLSKALLLLGWMVISIVSIQTQVQAQDIRLQYNNQQTSLTSGDMRPHLKLFNDGTQSLNLSDITIRYWFTSEPPGNDVYVNDYSALGTAHVNGNFGTIGDNRYLEIGFTSSAQIPGWLGGGAANEFPAGSNTGNIQNRIYDNGNGNYTQSNDYSFDQTITNYTNYDNITVYYQGNLVWGTPPAGGTEAESMEITQQPVSTDAGETLSPAPTVLLEDALGNPVEGVEVTITVNKNTFDGSTVIVTTDENGLAVFNDLILQTADTGYEFTFNADAELVDNVTSNSFDIDPAAPSDMSITSQPSQTTAGSTISPAPSVTITDQYGNSISGVAVTISLNKNSFNSGTTTVSTNSSGVASFNDLVINQATTGYMITFDADDVVAAGISNKNSTSFQIIPAAASTMTITTQPLESVDNGNIEGPPAVKVTDTYNNPISGLNVTVSETGGYTFDGGTLTRATNASGIATFNDLQITTPDAGYQLTFDADAAGVTDLTSNVFDVISAGGTMTMVTQPNQTTAGNIIAPSPSIELVDGSDNPISGINITVSLNKDGFDAGTYTVQTNGSGIATFEDLVIQTADTGYQLIFDADESGVANISSSTFDIVSSVATTLSMDTQPTTTSAGSSISGPPAVILTDTYGNPVSGVNVDVTINQNSFDSGTTTVTTNTNGIAEFDDLVITTATTGYMLTFSPDAAGVSNTTSQAFQVTAAAGSNISITVQPPSESTSENTISPAPRVLVVDAYGNPVPNKSVTVTLNQNSFKGGSTTILSTNSSGIAIFNDLRITTVDTGYAMIFSATGITSVTSNTFEVVQQDPPFGSIRVQYKNGDANPVVDAIMPRMQLFNDSDLDLNFSDITIRYWFTSEPSGVDEYAVDYAIMGQKEKILGSFQELEGSSNYFFEVAFSPTLVLPVGQGGDGSTANIFPPDATTGTMDFRIYPQGYLDDYTQTDDYSFDAAITTYQNHEYINVYYKGQLVWGTAPEGTSAPESIEISQQPTTTTAGEIISPSPTVLLEDAAGNPVSGIDVTASINKNNFTGGSTTIVTTNASGLAVFDNLVLEKAEDDYEITFDPDASLLSSITSNIFEVEPDDASQMTVTTQPPSTGTAGSTISPSPAVKVTDDFNNPIPGINVTISETGGYTINSGTLTQTTNSSGIATFNNLVITTANTGYGFTFNANAAGVANVNSNTFTIQPAPPTTMNITQQPLESIVNGNIEGPPAVTVLDTYNNPVPGINVAVSETGGYTFDGGTLTRTTNSSGVASFNDLEITTAGTNYRLTFNPDAGALGNKISNYFNVIIPAGSMTIITQPTETVAGESISDAPAIELLDGIGDPLANVDITVSLNKNSFASGTLTITTNGSGIATFNDLVIETADSGYELTFDPDESGVANRISTSFEVISAGPATMSVSSQPETTPVQTAIGGPPQITLVDDFNNPVSGVDVTVSLNKNSFSAGTTTVTTNSSGNATFTDLEINTVDTNYQITFNADTSGVNNVTSGTFNITADDPSNMEITVQPSESTRGVTLSPAPTVLVTDQYDNPVPGVNVTAALNQNNFSGGSTTIVSTNQNGLAVFSNLRVNTSATGYEITFSATSLTNVISVPFGVIDPLPPFGSIRLEYQNKATNNTSATIQPTIRVTNDSDLTLELDEITVRYWFSSEPTGTDQFNVYSTQLGSAAELTSTFNSVEDNYFHELGFTETADISPTYGGNNVANQMPPDATTGTIDMHISNSGGSGSFDQSNDYSFDPAITVLEDYVYINVYYKGQLVWGIAPAIPTIYYSRQTGNWDEPANWSPESHNGTTSTLAPQFQDTVIVGNGHKIVFTENITNNESVTIEATGTIATGSYILSGDGTFTLEDNATLEIGSPDGISSSGSTGNIQSSGTRTYSQQANYVYNGTVAQITGNGLPTQVDGDLTINNGNGVTHSNDLRVDGTLKLTSGSFTLTSGNNLIANNKSINNGDLIIEHTITGSTGWRMLSSPLSTTYGDLLDSTVTQGYSGAYYSTGSNPGDTLQPNVMYYDETYPGTDNQRWRAPSSAASNISTGQGLYTFIFGDIDEDPLYNDVFGLPLTLSVNGQENEGTVNFGVSYTTAADSGWNLVGNPYAATIDWDDSPDWTKTNIDNTIYVWDPASSNFKTWNGATGDLDSEGLIAPFQAFWVKANDINPSLAVTEDAKTFGGIFIGKEQSVNEQVPTISFRITNDEMEASTHFMFSENAKYGKDNMDAYRLIPPPGVLSYLDISSLSANKEHFAINNLPRSFGMPIEIPIYVDAYEKGYSSDKDIELHIDDMENIPYGWEIELIDNKNKSKINITQNTVLTFNQKGSAQHKAPNGGLNTSQPKVALKNQGRSPRFTLYIHPGADAVGLPTEFELKQNFPNPFNPTTKIQFELPLQSEVELSIFDILGRKITSLVNRQDLSAGTHTYDWNASNLSSGVYIYRLVTNEGIYTKKMMLVK